MTDGWRSSMPMIWPCRMRSSDRSKRFWDFATQGIEWELGCNWQEERMERSDINSEILRRLFDYWDSLRGGAEMPRRGDLDPIDIPHECLPFVMLFEVERVPLRFLIRLAGTRITDLYGQEPGGKYLDQVDLGDMADDIIASYQAVVEEGQAQWLAGHYRKEDGRELQFERIALPLTLEGNDVDQILVGAVLDRVETGDRPDQD